MERIQELLLWFIPFLFSLSFHETAHAWVASKLGDHTARYLGRVSMNPMVHADPVGTFILPIMGFLTQMPMIGWANPVPVIERNLRNPHRDGTLVALAGPVSNFFLACVFTLAIYLMHRMPHVSSLAVVESRFMIREPLMLMAQVGVQLNLMLGLFNLLPLPPLDGGRVLYGFFPNARETLGMLQRYSLVVFMLLLFSGALNVLVFSPAHHMTRILLSLALR